MGDKAAVQDLMQTVQDKIESEEVPSERYGDRLRPCVSRRSGHDAAQVPADLSANWAKGRRPQSGIGQARAPMFRSVMEPRMRTFAAEETRILLDWYTRLDLYTSEEGHVTMEVVE